MVDGVKKLFSLTKTKMRLAREADTINVRPEPLPLVKRFAQVELRTVEECERHWLMMKDNLDYADGDAIAKVVVQLCDIIEGVKWKFEEPDGFSLIDEEGFKAIESECAAHDLMLNLVLLSDEIPDGVTLYIGGNPPDGVHHLGRHVSNIAEFMDFAYGSKYFSDGHSLRNVRAFASGRNIISSAVAFSVDSLKKTHPN